jgi:hypothetical protein
MRRILALAALGAALLAGQARLSVAQLESFIKSAGQLRQDDKKVAAYLKSVKLRERLTEDALTAMLAVGIGQRTAEALRDLFDASKDLPAAAPPAPKPVYTPPPPPSPEEQRKLLDEIRDYSQNYSKRLPDFICTQVTRRYFDPTGLEFWQRQDVITARLSYFEQKEDYKVVLVNSRPVETTMDKVGGTTSAGEFGSMLREVFEPATAAEFKWARWATLGGRRVHVFEYVVPPGKGEFTISYEGRLVIQTPYRGLIYVDRDHRTVLRLTQEAYDIPVNFPIQQVVKVLDYDFVEIGGAQFILPLKSVIRAREAKLLTKNEVEFRMYRKFGADTAITFDVPDELPEDARTEEPAKPQ